MRSNHDSNPRRQSWHSAFRTLQSRNPEPLAEHLDANQLADLLSGRAPDPIWRHLSLCEHCRLAAVLATGDEQTAQIRQPEAVKYGLGAVPRWLPAAAALLLIGSAVWWRLGLPQIVQSPAPLTPAARVRRAPAPRRTRTATTTLSQAGIFAARPHTRWTRDLTQAVPVRHSQPPSQPLSGIQLATSLAAASAPAQPWLSEKAYAPRPSLTMASMDAAPAAQAEVANLRPAAAETRKMVLASAAEEPAPALASHSDSGHGIFSPLFSIRKLGMPVLQATWNQALMGTGHTIAQMDFAGTSREKQPLNTLVANPPATLNEATSETVMDASSAMAYTHWRLWRGQLQRSLVGQRYWEPIAAGDAQFSSFSGAGPDLWAGTKDGRLFFTHDGGQHWQIWQLRDAAGKPVREPIVEINMQGRTGKLRAQGLVWRTRDGGRHWSVR